MHTRSRRQKVEQLLHYKREEGVSDHQLAGNFAVSATTLRRWLNGDLEIPNHVSIVLEMVSEGSIPAPGRAGA